jgi:hypothetical protein
MLRSNRQVSYEYALLLHPSKELQQMAAAGHSTDVVKKAKGSASKPRYLLSCPGQFAPAVSAQSRSLTRPIQRSISDRPNRGKLRLRGTLLYPKGRRARSAVAMRLRCIVMCIVRRKLRASFLSLSALRMLMRARAVEDFGALDM